MSESLNSFGAKSTLEVEGKNYTYFDLNKAGIEGLNKLPKSLKVLLENLLRKEDGSTVFKNDVTAMQDWLANKTSAKEINFYPTRVMMQDFTGVPAVVDLAAMRDAMKAIGGNPQKINPQVPVDLVIDHSVNVEYYGDENSFDENVKREFEQNKERYEFLKWGQNSFENFKVVPPGTGIIHQVNLEYTANVVWTRQEAGETIAYCDSLVGTDSHTTMINGLSVLGWGVGGIEAEAAMLGQAVTMLIPEVIGFELKGNLKDGVTATDLVLTIVEMLRKKGVVGKFVEFYGEGLKELSLADRATIANMAPEYGATMGFFPIDDETIRFLKFSNRSPETVALVEAYAKKQGLWREENESLTFTDSLSLDMGEVIPSIAGPSRPQDRIELERAAKAFSQTLSDKFKVPADQAEKTSAVEGRDFDLSHGHVMIAAITSCTNTSNPNVLISAGLVAKKANELGLKTKPWVKTSLAPGSKVVTDYLEAAGLQSHLNDLGFNLVGYGCTTCIGNSGPLKPEFSESIKKADLTVTSVLSGNRNFEGRISPDIKANYLASPPLVVAYALAGSMKVDVTKDSLGKDKNGNDVYLKDLWPSNQEIQECLSKAITPEMFASRYSNVFEGTQQWKDVKTSEGETYQWDANSTYVKNPPFFAGMKAEVEKKGDIKQANILALLGDSVTTDHISPAGAIKPDSPAGLYLKERNVPIQFFNSYGSRRGNDDIMTRGTFANIRIKNLMLDNVEGGFSKHIPSGEQGAIYDVAQKYKETQTPLVVIAGKEYGTGSSRDWAAKGTRLLGVGAVIAESFERIHRSNLIGMGVLPLQFKDGTGRESLNLTGTEKISISGIEAIEPQCDLTVNVEYADGSTKDFSARVRIDTNNELEYFHNGGILHYVLRNLNK